MQPNRTITIGAILGGIWGIISALAIVGVAMAEGSISIIWQILTLPASILIWMYSIGVLPDIPISAPAWTPMAYAVVIGILLGALIGYIYDKTR